MWGVPLALRTAAAWVVEKNIQREINMKKADMAVYRTRLLQLRARLCGDVNAMRDAALNSNNAEAGEGRAPTHMADVGTDAYEQEFTLSLLENDGDTLGKIDAALERIDQEVYGSCAECEARIPKTRLNVLPYTPYCIKCASEIE